MDFPIINGDKSGVGGVGGSVLGFGFTNPYDLSGKGNNAITIK